MGIQDKEMIEGYISLDGNQVGMHTDSAEKLLTYI